MTFNKKKIIICSLAILTALIVALSYNKIVFVFSLYKADYFLQQQDYSQALSEYNKLIESNPDVYELHFNKGIILAKLEEYQDALTSLKKAESLNNKDPDLYYNLAHLYDIMGEKSLYEQSLERGTILEFEKNTGVSAESD